MALCFCWGEDLLKLLRESFSKLFEGFEQALGQALTRQVYYLLSCLP